MRMGLPGPCAIGSSVPVVFERIRNNKIEKGDALPLLDVSTMVRREAFCDERSNGISTQRG